MPGEQTYEIATCPPTPEAVLEPPSPSDGAALWRIARDSRSLDVNSPYSYLLWCRDFASTSVVARLGDLVAGFITGYRRPGATDTVVVWQIAVEAAQRKRGLGRRMLDHFGDRMSDRGCRYLEATVTPDNVASARLFASFASDRGAEVDRSVLFDSNLFPDRGHEPEILYRIGPLG